MPDYGAKYVTARERLLDCLSDTCWHSRKELERAAGNRYSARLLELRRLGYNLEDRESASGHGKDYRLISLKRGESQAKRVKVFLESDDVRTMLALRLIPASAKSALSDALKSYERNESKL